VMLHCFHSLDEALNFSHTCEVDRWFLLVFGLAQGFSNQRPVALGEGSTTNDRAIRGKVHGEAPIVLLLSLKAVFFLTLENGKLSRLLSEFLVYSDLSNFVRAPGINFMVLRQVHGMVLACNNLGGLQAHQAHNWLWLGCENLTILEVHQIFKVFNFLICHFLIISVLTSHEILKIVIIPLDLVIKVESWEQILVKLSCIVI
jgi:hypothetical protein